MDKFKTILTLILNDILFLVGSIFIMTATYRINVNAGLYVTGVFLLVFAVIISYKPKEKR